MKTCIKLNEFCKSILYYVAHGYKYAKIVYVPSHKSKDKEAILKKVEAFYNTGLTRGKRQAKKLRNEANFEAVTFFNVIVILKTSGEESITKPNEFQAFRDLKLLISEHLCLVLFKDEREKWTYRLGRETFLAFRADYEDAFIHGNGKKFHALQSKWRGLPKYEGIGKQRIVLNGFLKEWQKKFKRKWDIRF